MDDERNLSRWIAQAAAGNLAALQKLILIHHPRLRAIAAQRIPANLRGKLEPEDLLQQTYLDVVRRAGEFEDRGPHSFFRWLACILESKLIDAQRRFGAAARDVSREVGTSGPPSDYETLAVRAMVDSTTPSRIVARGEAEALLMATLAGLSPDHRQVLELRYLKGYPLADVAATMQRTPAAIQMLCARALRQLRAAIGGISRVLP